MVSMATGTFETHIRMKKGQAFLRHVLADATDSLFSVIQLTDIIDGRWWGSELEQVLLPSLFYPHWHSTHSSNRLALETMTSPWRDGMFHIVCVCVVAVCGLLTDLLSF